MIRQAGYRLVCRISLGVMTFLTVAQDFVAYFSWKKKELAMKKWIRSGLILAALNTLAFAQTDEWICKDQEAISAMERAAAEKHLNFRSSALTDDYDVKYHRLEWNINPNNYYISGKVTTYFMPKEANFVALHFDLSHALQVNNITFHGQEVTTFSQSNNMLTINLPNSVAMAELDSISVTYEGAPPSNGFGSFAQATHNGDPVLWTLSEPYGARDWWPCKQDLSDKIDSIDVLVRTPVDFKVASNGLLAQIIDEGEEHVYFWKHRYPIPAYLIAIAVTNYAEYSDFVPVEGGEPIEVLNYVFPENLSEAQQATTATVEIMQIFNDLFGVYPFANEKYGHAQFGWGGGMEHQTMSFMGGFSHMLQAHELAHQWFGDKVTCGSWQDIWLNEGFATYLEGLTYQYEIGPNTWQNWLTGKINHVTSAPGGSVFVTDTSSVSRIFSSRLSYSKGAMLLHMLRWKLGDEAFFQGVRNYVDAPELAYGYAKTDDLKGYLEAESGQDLTEFLEDWLYGQGYPTYHMRWFQDGSTLYVRLNQETSHPSVDFFEMPVPVRFLISGGIDTTIVFDHTFDGQQFAIEMPGNVGIVYFDQEKRIVSKGNTIVKGQFTNTNESLFDAIKVFPNPVSDNVYFSLPSGATLEAVRLFHVNGQLLTQRAGNISELNLGTLPVGIYTIELQTSFGVVRRLLTKQ